MEQYRESDYSCFPKRDMHHTEYFVLIVVVSEEKGPS